MSRVARERWQPLVSGDVAETARSAVHGIAASLAAAPAGTRKIDDPSAGTGRAGEALFAAYLARVEPSQEHRVRALVWLDQAIEAVATTPMGCQLYGGFPGIAWVAEHLQRTWLSADGDHGGVADDLNDEIDQALAEALERTRWGGDYDLISGLVGLGVYALERLPRPSGVRCLERVVARLAETAVERPEGLSWYTPPEALWHTYRHVAPEGCYNLGVAHGVPGVIGLLGEVCGRGIAEDRARPLLAGAVDWLLAQRLGPGERSCFADFVGPGVETEGARLAWCYGDAGIAVTLLLAGRRAGQPAWEREALDIARRAARRAPETANVNDAALCHGAAGLAHLFNRLHQASGDPPLAEAARYWLSRALDYRRPGEGIGGFSTWEPDEPDGDMGHRPNRGFLNGAAGIGLALLAATSDVEPSWDLLLLASVPPR